MIKPLDTVFSGKKIKSFIVLLLTFFTFYPQIMAINSYIHIKNISRGEFPREMMKTMVKQLKPTDIIIVNNASNTEFEYYSSFYNIKNEIFREKLSGKPDANYLKLLNSFPKGYYWLYLPYDYSHTQVIPTMISWAKTKTILYISQNAQSVLLYIYVK
jgi:hypothetical protein